MAKKKLSSYQKLKKNMKALKHELNDKELELREQIIKNLNTEEIKLQNKLISKLLNAKIKNKGLMNYHELLNNDFLEFANYEESLSNEAEAIIKLQTIEKSLKSFQATLIYLLKISLQLAVALVQVKVSS